MKRILTNFIKRYKSVSQWLWQVKPPFFIYSPCRFQPTCSEYALEAIEKYGPRKGAIKAAARLCRCHPFSQGGYDPIQ
ncbi:MAG TPA: membrane protein insertion efficiency factor YidD [Candidatus Paceibacterota bacterium]